MRIGINTRFLLSSKMEGFGWYTFEIVKRIVKDHPEHEFIFFFDRPFDEKFIFGANVTPVVLNPPARHPILFVFWFEIALKRALKKHKIDLFFSPDGYLSLASNVPQVGVIHDINFEHYPEDIPFAARKYLRFFFPKFARKAKKIITVSEYSKQDIQSTYQIPSDKIVVAWNGASDEFKPLSHEEIIQIRKTLTKGAPYFLFVGAIHPRKNVKRLIDSFIELKLQHQSPYHLVIVGASLWKNNPLSITIPESIKDSIHFTGHLSLTELSEVMASAEIFAYVPYFEGFGIPLVEAMKCGTPILSGNKTSLPEVAGPAAIYCDPFDVQDICAKMKLLSEDAELRKKLSVAGMERSKEFSWQKASEKVFSVLIDVWNKKDQ